jgi:hypothetical protein
VAFLCHKQVCLQGLVSRTFNTTLIKSRHLGLAKWPMILTHQHLASQAKLNFLPFILLKLTADKDHDLVGMQFAKKGLQQSQKKITIFRWKSL